MRYFFIFAAALMALAGSLVAAAATMYARDTHLRAYVDPAQSSDLPYRVPRLGVNVELTGYSDDELRQHFAWMQQAGVTWVRQTARWDLMEAEPGQYDFEDWDRITSIIADYPELQLLAVFMNTPDWARISRASSELTAPPEDPDDFAAFVRAFVQRYRLAVDYYQVWDEPNLRDAWGGLNPSTAHYVAMLRAAYDTIHGQDEGATVLLAGLAPTTETGPTNISDWLYLSDLYALGARDFMDAVAAKPYGFDASPDEPLLGEEQLIFARPAGLREIMVANGDAHKAIWFSHFGWNALPADWQGEPSIWGEVTSQQQIDHTLAALDRIDQQWPWVGGAILQHWQPSVPNDDPQWGFALIGQDDQPGPLWQALIEHTAPEVAANGLYHPITPHARYSGVWTLGELGADIGWLETSDSQLAFDFYGRDLSLLLREDDYVAFLYPTIDGQPANAAPRDNQGNAYLFLRSDTLEPDLTLKPVARGLPLEQHTLNVVTDRGWDRWAIAGYAVSSGDLSSPYNQQILIAALTSALAAVVAVVTAWRLPWAAMLGRPRFVLDRMQDSLQIAISLVTSIALMLGMLLTWGDAIPAVFRREPVHLILAIATAGLVYLQPGFILTLIALMILFVLVYHRLEWGLLLALVYAPFFLFPVALYSFAFPMTELVMLVTTAAGLLRLFVHWGRIRQSASGDYPLMSPVAWLRKRSHLDYGVAAWLAMGLLSLLWTERLPQAVTELRTMMIEPALFYLLFRTLSSRRRTLVRMVDALIVSAVLVSLIGLFLFVQGEAIITAEGGARRLASVYGSPNNVALYLGRAIPFALAYVLVDTGRHRRILAAVALAIMLVTVALTQSVGGLLLGLPVAVAIVIVLLLGRRALLPLLGLGLVGAGGVVVLTRVSARFASLLDLSEGTNFIRLRLWESTLSILRDRPLTGLGLDQFLYDFRGHYIRPDAIWDRDLSHPHNVILDFWIRLGIGGLLVLLWIQHAFWRSALAAWRRHRHDGLLLALSVGAMGSMGNLLAHGLIDNSVYVMDLAYVFVFILALVQHLLQLSPIDADRVK